MVESESPEWRARIGWVKPGPVMRSIDRFFGLLPADVDVAISTTSWSEQITNQERFDATAIDRPIETLIHAVSDLQRYDRIDVAMVTGDFIQAALGPAWNDEARRAVAEASGLPALTAMTAATDALRAVGATRIAVATPFSATKNEHVRAYLAAEGFAVERMTGLDTPSSRGLHALPADTPYRAGLAVVREAPAADTLYLPSLSWGAERFADQLEQELNIPVVTLYGSLVWSALTAVQYPGPVKGYGRLLRMVGQG